LALYLDLDTYLYGLGGRNTKIHGREIGVEVHCGELRTAIPDALPLGITITCLK
jgi:hypothetical protein